MLPEDPERLRVLYVSGASWSGSTLLEQMLSQLRGVASVGELYWLWKPFWPEMQCECGEPFADCEFWRTVLEKAYGHDADAVRGRVEALGGGFVRHSIWPLVTNASSPVRPRAVLRELAELVQPIYESVAAVTGASTIVDTTKVGMWGIAASRAPRLDVRVVHLVRDPLGYVSSDSQPRQRAYPLSEQVRGRHPARSAVTWALQNLSGDLSRTLVDERAVVLYRDLVTYPRQTLEQVARIAGLDVDVSKVVAGNALTVRTLGHAIGGSSKRPRVGTTEIRDHGPGDGGAAPFAVRTAAAMAAPLWLHYRRAACRSIQHEHERVPPRIGTGAPARGFAATRDFVRKETPPMAPTTAGAPEPDHDDRRAQGF